MASLLFQDLLVSLLGRRLNRPPAKMPHANPANVDSHVWPPEIATNGISDESRASRSREAWGFAERRRK
jgi:hypothetical protein